MVFKNRVLWKTVETKGGGTNRRLKYYLVDEIKDMRWAEHMEGMEREQCIQHFVWEIGRNLLLGRHTCRWEVNMEMDVK